ncbi:hypothetical protein K5549_009230 [Capra hircus]|nr:hypothetical protein K5549_009230 [Capra hircus]
MSSGNAEIGHRAPQFKAIVVVPDGRFKDISLSDYREKYAVFFFHPLDFTFVYPMEIIAFSDRAEELKKLNCQLNCQVMDVSVDFHFLSPKTRRTGAREHSLDIRLQGDLPVGDSVDETLRLVQAFQFIDTHGKVCPAGWKPGSNTIKSDVQKSKEYFSKWPWAILGPGCNRRP